MRKLPLVALLGVFSVCGSAMASADLAESKQCMQCHKVKEDFAGPSFHKIALTRKGERDSITKMVATIRLGSGGTGSPHWGAAKMPDAKERPEVSPAEARTLAQWILKQ